MRNTKERFSFLGISFFDKENLSGKSFLIFFTLLMGSFSRDSTSFLQITREFSYQSLKLKILRVSREVSPTCEAPFAWNIISNSFIKVSRSSQKLFSYTSGCEDFPRNAKAQKFQQDGSITRWKKIWFSDNTTDDVHGILRILLSDEKLSRAIIIIPYYFFVFLAIATLQQVI